MLLAGAALAAEPLAVAVRTGAASDLVGTSKPSSATLENKLRLVKQLLTQGPAAQRIPQSANAQAKKLLADAQGKYAKAQAEAGAGRGEVASQLLDEALRQIASASSLVPDVVQQEARERNNNQQLREAIVIFQSQQSSRSGRVPSKVQADALSANTGPIDAMLDQADTLMSSGNQHEASGVLNSAYKMVVSTLNKMLASETIVYGLKFDNPADEFRHELARNRSYEELIPIALVQLNAAPETAVLAERYVRQSRDLREAAQKRASGGDYPAAVKTMQDATGHLQRSLRIAGVVVPQSPEFTP